MDAFFRGLFRKEAGSIASAEYIIDGTTLTEYVGPSACVRVPEGVSAIAPGAFRDRKQQIEEVILPDSLREIMPRTFASCRCLRHVKLPAGLRAIGAGAFQDCEALTEVEIPSGVRSLRRNTFSGCRSLRTVTLRDGLQTLEDGAFKNCSALTEIHLPGSLRAVGSTAAQALMEGGVFAGSGLEELRVPAGVETIGSAAFLDCRQLRAAWLPEGLHQIGSCAFSGCRGLRRLRIPATVKTIGSAAFRGCSHPEEIVLPRRMEKMRMNAGLGFAGEYDGCIVENGVMTGCLPNLRQVRIPAGVTTIRAGAFNALVENLRTEPRSVAVQLPEALEVFERSRSSLHIEFLLPPEYLQQTSPLPMPFTLEQIAAGALPVSLQDAVHLFLFQPGELSQYALGLLRKHPQCAGRAMYQILRRRRTPRAMLRTAAFAEEHARALQDEILPALYRLALAAGMGAAAARFAWAAEGTTGLEKFCREAHDPLAVDERLRQAGLDPDSTLLTKVRLREGGFASAHLIKCLLQPYLYGEPRLLRTSDPEKLRLTLDPESRQLERAVDPEALQQILDDLFPAQELYANPQWFPAYCRFAGSLQISAYDRKIRELYQDNKLLRWFASAALTLNDTREAMCRSAEHPCSGRFRTLLEYWSHIRGRGVPFADGAMRVHLDAGGVRRFDFPGCRLEVRLGSHMALQVWDPESGEMILSQENWGLSPADAATLTAEIAEMEDRLAEFLETERRMLRRCYISGRGFTVPQWERLYLRDPVRRKAARGLIWTQGRGRSFRVGPDGPARPDGSPVLLQPGRRICLAHVMEMDDAERSAWQAAPEEAALDQLGERVRCGKVPPDYYNGLTITAEDKLRFDAFFGCSEGDWRRLAAGVQQGSFAMSCRPEEEETGTPAAGSLIQLGSFCCFREDRASNLALNLLDDMVIRGCIRADDPAALRLIAETGCAGRQLRSYLDLALSSGARQTAAALLEMQRLLPPEEDELMLI